MYIYMCALLVVSQVSVAHEVPTVSKDQSVKFLILVSY